MSTRSWGVELWDQVDNLLQFENDQLAVHDHHYRLLVEIQKLISEFGKKYRKTVSSFVPKKRLNTTMEHKLTYNNVLIDSLASFIEMGMAFEGYGNELQHSVITPLKAEYDREKKIAEKVTIDYGKYNSTREREKRKLEDTWRAHVNALKEKQKAEAQNTLAQNDPNISAEERQKAQAFLSAKQQAFVETQQSYASEMSSFNENQRFHFTHNVNVLIADLEMIDRQRARITQNLLTKCSDLGDVLAKKLSDSAIALRKTVSRIDPEEDCKTVLEARKTEYLFPVDLPFLNLAQCTQATLENQSALVKLMLGSSNGYSVKSTEKASKGLHNLFGKSKSQTSDGNVLQTPFIAGIGYKPVKESDMTVIQLNDRIIALKKNLDKVQKTLSATQDSDSDVDDPVAPTHKGDYVGEATLKYDCEGNDDGCISGKAGEVFYVLEEDNDGSGWTAVVSADGLRQGFLPTSHMDITLY
ncbi:unnamed protein product [Rodentolepis nana]|uniref:SH3 domain-containing protein n=1 Tax=Rodentolepis nana TaxID=102285 RepID=A0A158QIE0_RODNA|nr:unnamed protein product [Rodentolepis nana]